MALLGAGRWGTSHLRTLLGNDEVELAAICDRDEGALAAAGGLAPNARLARHLDDLDLRALDALVVATSTATHASIAAAALEAGLHVLLEKPLASRPADVSVVLGAARRAGRTLMLGCQMLHHPAHRALVAIAPSLSPHALRTVRASRPRASADGLLEALAPHDLATVVTLLDTLRPGARLRCEDAGLERDSTIVAHLRSDDPAPLSVELRWARTSGPIVRTTTLSSLHGDVTVDEATGGLSCQPTSHPTPESALSLQLSAFIRRTRGLPAPGLSLEQIETVAQLADAIAVAVESRRDSSPRVNRVSRWRNEESRH
jgi:predicted dehydrogenase